MNESIFGQKVKTLRLALGLTQEELGQKADITKDHISRIELGKFGPGFTNILSLANALGVTESELFTPDEEAAHD